MIRLILELDDYEKMCVNYFNVEEQNGVPKYITDERKSINYDMITSLRKQINEIDRAYKINR